MRAGWADHLLSLFRTLSHWWALLVCSITSVSASCPLEYTLLMSNRYREWPKTPPGMEGWVRNFGMFQSVHPSMALIRPSPWLLLPKHGVLRLHVERFLCFPIQSCLYFPNDIPWRIQTVRPFPSTGGFRASFSLTCAWPGPGMWRTTRGFFHVWIVSLPGGRGRISGRTTMNFISTYCCGLSKWCGKIDAFHLSIQPEGV